MQSAHGGRRRKRAAGDAQPVDATAFAGRVPPHDLSAEKAVLSSLLLDPRAFHEVLAEVKLDDFYHPAHQLLFAAMSQVHDAGRPVDLITLSEHLTLQKQLDSVGGPVALAEIADYAATAANVTHHARIVRDKAVKRRLIGVATEIVQTGYEETESADKLLDFAESKIFDVSKEQSRSSFQNLHDEMPGVFDYVEGIMNRAGALSGLPTGYDDLDEMTGGLQPGELLTAIRIPATWAGTRFYFEKVRDRDYATLWPTHGPPVTKVRPFVQAYLDHRLTREAQIVAQLERGVTRIKQMVPVIYADIDPKLHPAACHSVLAHMIRLVEIGRVTCAGGLPCVDEDYRLVA